MDLTKDVNKPRGSNASSPTLKLSNGYTLPVGITTPNAIFVGGIDMTVNQDEIWDFFARYGTVKEVRIITSRGGICKGYGFVYFGEEVNIQSIIEITFNGRKLKLGPAIMKDRHSRPVSARLFDPLPAMSSAQFFYCTCCAPVGGVAQSSPIMGGGSPYNQPYPYSNFGGLIMPPVPMNYPQNIYTYQYSPTPWTAGGRTHSVNQNFVDCGVQTMLTVL